jgi:UDP-N-acetylglucosamine--N-acetylmuramyl-(pentapeptide) pyrophosphoryl-undecaprenol N-acetylglucosamine transferase
VINNAMIEALPHLNGEREVVRITHQTGDADFEKVTTGYREAGWVENVEVMRYIDDMVSQFARADLIISRAGATTAAELMAAGKAAIMVPLPGQMEQQRNAEALQEAGAARMILNADLTGERLAREMKALIENPSRIPEMEAAARHGARRDAAGTAVDLIEELIEKKRR